MSLKVDKVQLEIIMKSDTTRAEIIKLEDQAKRLQKEMKKFKKNPEELAKASAKYNEVKTKISDLRNEIGLAAMNIRELQQRQRELNTMMRNIDPRTEKFAEYRKELTQVNTRMRELKGNAQNTESLFSRANTVFNKYGLIIGGFIASITGISMTFRRLAEDVAKMDDVYSDVIKTTNMTRDEVLALNEEFKKMDTRTSRESLNKLARDAGKLGIEGSKNILDFVDAGNQINVALGEDLGEDAIKNIGKMVGVFEKSDKHLQTLDLKGQMLAVGSAINQLGASSSANEGYLVQFAGRLGGIAAQAGISIDQILGFGSALDQDMQQVEMSATAIQNFIMKIMGEPAKFAKIAGKDVKEFTALLQTDANAAIKDVLRSLNAQGGFQQLIPIFNEMGLDGARAVGVLSSMASSINKIDEAQRVANQSLIEGTSVTKEYSTKNENLMAQLEKARKNFKEVSLQLGENLNPALLTSTKAASYLIKGLVFLIDNWNTVGKVLLIITGYTMAYNGKLLLNNILLKEGIGLKVKNLALKLKDVVVSEALILKETIHAATIGKTTLATKAAAVAQVIWNNAIKANPVGFLIGALTTVVGIIWLFANRTKEITALQQAQLNIQQKVKEQYDEQAAKIDILNAKIRNENLSNTERKKALEELKAIIPEYNGMLDKEGKLINDNKAAIDNYLISLEKQIKMKAIREEWENLIREERKQKKVKEQAEKDLNISKNTNKTPEVITGGDAGIAGQIGRTDALKQAQGKYNEELEKYNSIITAKTALEAEMKTNAPARPPEPGPKEGDKQQINGKWHTYKNGKWVPDKTTDYNPTEDKNAESKAKKAADKLTKEAEDNYKNEMVRLQREYLAKEKTEKQFEDESYLLKKTYLSKKLDAEKTYGKSTGDTHLEQVKTDIEHQQKMYKIELDELTEHQNAINLATLEAYRKGEITEKEFEDTVKQNQLDFLNEKLLVQQKYAEKESLIQTEAAKDVSSTLEAIENARVGRQKDADEARLKALKDTYDSGIKAIESGEQTQSAIIEEGLAQGLIKQKEYERLKLKLALKAAKARLAIAKATYQAVSKTEFSSPEKKKEALKDAKGNVDSAEIGFKGANTALVKFDNETSGKFKTTAEKMQSIFGDTFSTIGKMFESFYDGLDKLRRGDLKSAEDWGQAIGGIVQSSLAVAQQMNDQYYDYKRNELEADKQHELTIAGDNAEKRKEIEQDYAQKELDLKKKQADADAGIKIAQTISAGALAIMQAFAQLGPVKGTIAAITIAATTTLQLASIKKQRDAIMATTLDGSGGGENKAKDSGQRVSNSELGAVQRYEKGSYDVIGADDGKTYRNVPYRGIARTGLYRSPALVAESGEELIVDNPTLRNIRMNAPEVLSAIRRMRVRQYADGNYDALNDAPAGANPGANPAENNPIMIQFISLMGQLVPMLRYLKENGINAFVMLSELERKQAMRDKSLKIGSK